jgi:hypothetical protein
MRLENTFVLAEWASVPLFLFNEGLVWNIGTGLLFGSYLALQLHKSVIKNDPHYKLKNPDVSEYAGVFE